MKTRIIVNPMANKGRCGKRWPQIRTELEKHLGPIDDDDIAMTRARNHATKLAQEAVDAGYRRLISVGGDGTFSEMMNGVISDDRPDRARPRAGATAGWHIERTFPLLRPALAR